jgi:hypothetical protein
MRRRVFAVPVFLALMLVLVAHIPAVFSLDDVVKQAVLNGNWQEVIKKLERDNRKAKDPVARLLMGHATLATNRNNQSMLLFLSIRVCAKTYSCPQNVAMLGCGHEQKTVSNRFDRRGVATGGPISALSQIRRTQGRPAPNCGSPGSLECHLLCRPQWMSLADAPA